MTAAFWPRIPAPRFVSRQSGERCREDRGKRARRRNVTPARIVKLQEAWGQAEKAAEWRARLAAGRASTRPVPTENVVRRETGERMPLDE